LYTFFVHSKLKMLVMITLAGGSVSLRLVDVTWSKV